MTRLTFIVCLLIAVALATYQGIRMVKPAGVTHANMRDVNYLNVKKDLQVIAAQPHPTASPHQAKVRRYLQETITEMGYRVEEQPFTFAIADLVQQQRNLYAKLNEAQRQAFDAELARVGAAGDFEKEVRIRSGLRHGEYGQGVNLIVRHTVAGATDSVIFMAHYDSVGTAPGASDNGMAVASLLQLMRETISRDDVKNNIIFLFTDAEELGLVGAKHFVAQLTPDARQAIGAVINFEARGNQGVPLLFETSAQNYRLINALNQGVRNIVAFSFTPLIYQMLQNDTDLTAFKPLHRAGLNFAVVEGFEHYHHMSDTVENLPLLTLFRYQNTVREVGRQFIHKVDISKLYHKKDAIYFPLPSGRLLVMPLIAAYLSGISVFILCAMLAWQRRAFQALTIILPGLLCVALAILLPTAAYMVTLPMLFYMTQAILRPHRHLADLTTLLGVYFTGLLYVPVLYLIAYGLQLPFITAILGLMIIGLWSIPIATRIRHPASLPMAEDMT
ncbi:M28 family metallopeptidase [Serratia rubidaea]|uniref:M28 family metallopeptidase n=1 Tax=Serratia rubidaea TaxID=61652 RepID=UPI0022B9052F|nr:M28 family metallopeptidase [Serratia rubidaea]WBF45727.1 M28 family metallopeptidase [Serratia rubidaea]